MRLGGGAIILIVIVSLLFGVNPMSFLGMMDAGGPVQTAPQAPPARPSAPASEKSDPALAFVQRTSFDVAYRLTLSADGKRLVGTATTPEGVFSVTWERERPTDVDLVEQGHLEY